MGPDVYPWGLALLLTPLYALFGKNIFILKLPCLLCFAVFSIYCYRLARKEFCIFVSTVLTLCFALSANALQLADSVGSDIPFLCFSTMSVYYAVGLFDGCGKKKQMINGVLAGLFMFWANNTRTNGIVLVLTLLAMHIIILFRKNKRIDSILSRIGLPRPTGIYPAAHIAAYAVFAAGTIVMCIALPLPAKGHIAVLQMITSGTIRHNIICYTKTLIEFFSFDRDFSAQIYGIFLLFFLYGFCRHFLRNAAMLLYTIYIAGTLAMYVLWPYSDSHAFRFVLPLVPMCAIFTVFGIKDALQHFSHTTRTVLAIAGIAAMFMSVPELSYDCIMHGQYTYPHYRAYTTDTMAMYEYIKENTKPSDIIVFFKPRVLYLETGRLGFYTEDISRLDEADYLLLSKDWGSAINYDIEAQYPEESKKLQLVKEIETIKLYKVK